MHVRRARRAVARGKKPSVIPYIGYGSTDWVRVLGRVLYLKPESREHTRFRPDVAEVSRVRGWRTFTSLSVPHQPVRVLIDGEPVTEVVADRGGVIDSIVPVSLSPGWHTLTLQTGDSEAADAPIKVLDPKARIGVISDIDDTILITTLPRPFVAAWNSFVLDEHARSATPGMAVMLDHLVAHHPGSPVVYLSTGAWNAAPALSRFLARNLYPMGPMLLTDWGPTHDRWFRSGKEHKRRELQRLAREFPDTRWVLFGDDGQHDEAIYSQFLEEHPSSVAGVAIRRLLPAEAVLAGGRASGHHAEGSVPWVSAEDGAGLRERLGEVGILRDPS